MFGKLCSASFFFLPSPIAHLLPKFPMSDKCKPTVKDIDTELEWEDQEMKKQMAENVGLHRSTRRHWRRRLSVIYHCNGW
jgi:hypothetical protein